EKFIEAGSKVNVTGRRGDRLQKIREKYPDIITHNSDIANDKQRGELADWVLKNHPELNVLINNAGVQLLADLKKPVDLNRVRQETETNFIAPIHLTSLFAEHLASKKNAAIVNISS